MPHKLKVPEAKGRLSRAHHEELEERISNSLKNEKFIHTARGRLFIQKRLGLLEQRQQRIGRLSPAEKTEREIELGMLRRVKLRTYPRDPKSHRWVTMVRNRAHLLGPGAGSRVGGEWRKLATKIKKREFKNPEQMRRAEEVLNHLGRDFAMYAVWAETENAHLMSDQEIESRITQKMNELEALR